MLARDEIVSALGGGVLPAEVDVIPYARNIAAPLRPTVMVRIDKVRPSKAAGAMWDVEGALVLIGPQTTGDAAEDALEDLLHDVLRALDRQDVANSLTWSEATRATYSPDPDEGPTNPAYEVAVFTNQIKES